MRAIVTILCAAAAAGVPARAAAEEACRVVLWPADGAPEAAVAEASARLEGVCEVLPLPAAAAAGPSAEASEARAEASAVLEAAQGRYYEADFAAAAELLGEAVEARAPSLARSGALDTLGSLLLWQGAALAKLARAEEAEAAFRFALAVGVGEIDRALFPPEVTRVFDRARERSSRAAPVTLTIDTEPSEASLEVDGRAAGTSEATVELSPGRHAVVARRPGYRAAVAVVEAEAEGAAVTLTLEPADAEEAAAQVAALRRDGLLDGGDPVHRALVETASGADRVALVDQGGEAQLLDAAGEPAAWPEPPAPPEPDPGGGGREPEPPRPPPETPLVRQWWLWVAVAAGAALVATAVGLGVYYGTMEWDTFTLVPGERP